MLYRIQAQVTKISLDFGMNCEACLIIIGRIYKCMSFVKTLSLDFQIRRSSTMVGIYINKMCDSHLVPVYVALYLGDGY